MRLWKRRAATETDQSADPPAPAHDAAPHSASVPSAPVPNVPVPNASTPSVPSQGPLSAQGQHPGTRTLRGRVQRGGALAQALPAVTTVTAYRRDGYVVANTVSEDGSYVLDGLPSEPLTLVAVEHPAVHEDVVVQVGDQRHDIALPAFPRRDLP